MQKFFKLWIRFRRDIRIDNGNNHTAEQELSYFLYEYLRKIENIFENT